MRQASSSDCGAAALTMALRFHGVQCTLAETRGRVGDSSGMQSAQSLLEAARSFGVAAVGVRVVAENAHELPCGSILHWSSNHYVVLGRSSRAGVIVHDPSVGKIELAKAELAARCSGVALLFSPPSVPSSAPAEHGSYQHLAIVMPPRREVARACLFGLSTASLVAIGAAIARAVVDVEVPGRQYFQVLASIAFVITCAIVHRLVVGHTALLKARVSAATGRDVSLEAARRLLRQPYPRVLTISRDALVTARVSIGVIVEIAPSMALTLAIDGAKVLVYVVAMGVLSPVMATVAIALEALRCVVRWRTQEAQSRRQELLAARHGHASTAYCELIDGLETIKALGAEAPVLARVTSLLEARCSSEVALAVSKAGVAWGEAGLSVFKTGVLMLTAAGLLMRSSLTLGQVVAFGVLAICLDGAAAGVVASARKWARLQDHIERLETVVGGDASRAEFVGTSGHELSGQLKLERVWFGESGAAVLQGVSLEIGPGQCVVIVCSSAAERTAIARILSGLSRPLEGHATGDGHDLYGWRQGNPEVPIALVAEDAYLFTGTIRSNIAMALREEDEVKIAEAVWAANLEDELGALADGLDTAIRENGLGVPDGVRQRVAIARAVVARPRVVVLEESTSAIDSRTEQTMCERICSTGASVAIVSLKARPAVKADRVYAVVSGRIAEDGAQGGWRT